MILLVFKKGTKSVTKTSKDLRNALDMIDKYSEWRLVKAIRGFDILKDIIRLK